MKTLIKALLRESLLTEETFTDLFQFLEQDPRKMTMGAAYYVADMNGSMNKNMLDAEGNKVANPMYGKIYKHTLFRFRWADTYSRAMEKANPEHVMGQRSGSYEKVQGYDVLEQGKSGLYLPIIPTGSNAKYTVFEGGKHVPIDYEDVKKYLRPVSSSMGGDDNKPKFRPLIVDKIYRISGGGNIWVNPNFKGQYMGPNS